ncbi:MAG: hypothetical protein M1355_00270 [Patescibacteria group bacterium]|nr:hypothetical protein [Patescibacteria group bacterium]MCL5093561.1 hypothetical protein [Patescibacteria group bacterium]
MKVLVFTKEDGPEMREAIDKGKELEADDFEVEYYDTDEVEGISKAQLYDIYSTPSFVAVRDDGSLAQIWRGIIPTTDELKSHLNI